MIWTYDLTFDGVLKGPLQIWLWVRVMWITFQNIDSWASFPERFDKCGLDQKKKKKASFSFFFLIFFSIFNSLEGAIIYNWLGNGLGKGEKQIREKKNGKSYFFTAEAELLNLGCTGISNCTILCCGGLSCPL